jgi:hypothetical protein
MILRNPDEVFEIIQKISQFQLCPDFLISKFLTFTQNIILNFENPQYRAYLENILNILGKRQILVENFYSKNYLTLNY